MEDAAVTPLYRVIEDFIKLEGHSLDVILDSANTAALSKGRLDQNGFIVLIMGQHCYDVYDVAKALEAGGFRTRNVSTEGTTCPL